MTKQQKAERILERTAAQAESVARAIQAADRRERAEAAEELHEAGLDPHSASPANLQAYSVICPECGQLVPSEYDSFLSQEDANRYALEHCDCQKAGPRAGQEPEKKSSGEIMPREQLMGIMFTPAPSPAPQPPRPPQFGACRYCGQAQSVSGCQDEAQAEEYATRNCRCAAARSYQDKLEEQRRREVDLRKIAANIDDLFTDNDRGGSVETDVLDILKQGAQLVYDRKIANLQIGITYTIKAKISRNSKGNIAIERKDATASKLEV